MEYELKIKNIDCSSCIDSLKKIIDKIENVEFISFDLLDSTLVLELDDDIKIEEVINILKNNGYKVENI